MKKFLFFTFIISLIVSVNAQENISNPDFELWDDNSTPTGWCTSISGNIMTEVFGVQIPIPISSNFCTKVSDSQSGNYAVSLYPTALAFEQMDYNMPGMLQLGSNQEFSLSQSFIDALMNGGDISDDDYAELNKIVASGVPFTRNPTAIKLWVKFLPDIASLDILSFYAYTSSWSSAYNVGLPVATGELDIDEAIDQFTQVTIPFTLENGNSACDTLRFVATIGGDEPSTSSICYIDNITFEFGTGIDENEWVDCDIYPNPASSQINIAPANNNLPYAVTLFDVSGRVIYQAANLSNTFHLSTSTWSDGLYFLKFSQNNQETVKKIIIK